MPTNQSAFSFLTFSLIATAFFLSAMDSFKALAGVGVGNATGALERGMALNRFVQLENQLIPTKAVVQDSRPSRSID